MKVIGIDSGSTTTKGVLIEDGNLIDQYLIGTQGNPKGSMKEVLTYLGYQPEEMTLVSTGYGRKLVQADHCITEITCHAVGVRYLDPTIEQIIDIGGQDCKAIKLSSKGKVLDFNMNDKCAAGTGRFVDVQMRILGEDIKNLDSFVKDATPEKINSMCTVFAESEVIGLIAQDIAPANIALGVLHSIVHRISNQYAKVQPKPDKPLFLSGGLAQSQVIRDLLSQYTETEVKSHPDAQFAGAIGAAMLGLEKATN